MLSNSQKLKHSKLNEEIVIEDDIEIELKTIPHNVLDALNIDDNISIEMHEPTGAERPYPLIHQGTSEVIGKDGTPVTNDKIHQNIDIKSVVNKPIESRYPLEELIPFLTKLACTYSIVGVPASRLEYNMAKCSQSMGVYASYQCLPTALTITFGTPEMLGSITKSIRIAECTVDCGKMYQLERLISRINHDKDYTLEFAKSKLDRIIHRKPHFGKAMNVICKAINSGAAAGLFFNGTWVDVGISTTLGLIVGLVIMYTQKFSNFSRLSDFLCAMFVSMIALIADNIIKDACYMTIALASIISLLPGLSLTISIRELETDCISSGTVRLINSCLVAFKLGFGLAIGSNLPIWIKEKPTMTLCSEGLVHYWYILFFPILSTTFNVYLDSKLSQWPGMSFCALIGYAATYVCRILKVPNLVIPSIAAFFIASTSNLISRYSSIPGVTFIFSGVLFLMPGFIGVESFLHFFSNDSLAGIEIGFGMIVVSVSMTVGTFLANIFTTKKVFGNRLF